MTSRSGKQVGDFDNFVVVCVEGKHLSFHRGDLCQEDGISCIKHGAKSVHSVRCNCNLKEEIIMVPEESMT